MKTNAFKLGQREYKIGSMTFLILEIWIWKFQILAVQNLTYVWYGTILGPQVNKTNGNYMVIDIKASSTINWK